MDPCVSQMPDWMGKWSLLLEPTLALGSTLQWTWPGEVMITPRIVGLGVEYTSLYAITGAKVYMACRSMDRAKAAADEIKKDLNIGDDKILVRELDLSSFASVRAFAKQFKSGNKGSCQLVT